MIYERGRARFSEALSHWLEGCQLCLFTNSAVLNESNTPFDLVEAKGYAPETMRASGWVFRPDVDGYIFGSYDDVTMRLATKQKIAGWFIRGIDGSLIAADYLRPEMVVDTDDALLITPQIKFKIGAQHGRN